MDNRNGAALDVFVTGLKNAHAMEKQALSIMEPQIDRIEHYPQLASRLKQHRAETQRQLKRLEGVLDTMGENPSMLKDTMLSMMGGMASVGHAPAGDEILKQSFADFAFENYEIAAYRSLIQMAEQAGQHDAIGPLRQNLEEEEEMADWLEANLPEVTREYVARREQGLEAKH